ncbi:MAG: triacylglycerol lipase [Lachnospiraceae bacterium]|nr:triacylglycerol lipase [Lachnospiraceae bacterium]
MKTESKVVQTCYLIVSSLILTFIANSFWMYHTREMNGLWWASLILFVLINVFPSLAKRYYPSFRLRMCFHGVQCLKMFLVSALLSLICEIVLAFSMIPDQWELYVINLLLCIVVESIVFWNGIISVYVTSKQLGLKHRIIGIVCGWIPFANMYALGRIIGIASAEVEVEINKALLDKSRQGKDICATRYPLLMVHGVFFRDFQYFNYWGRIPKELERNGAIIYYGDHQSAASVKDSGAELEARIRQIIAETGCEKVNIIAHSKGGLDSRYAISQLGMAPYVASITTINTPHRGCVFADYLLGKIPKSVQDNMAAMYNGTLKKLGDPNPDFLAAVYDLTASRAVELNELMPDMAGIYEQSVGSKLNVASGGRFPLNFSQKLVEHFDGDNDGLVGYESFAWGEDYTYLTVEGRRGISHGDMIDLNRENFPGFDVREFYVQLVADLKKKGF